MKRIALIICIIVCFIYSSSVFAGYQNDWVKYADDNLISFSLDRNSIAKNNAGNYNVLILMVPHKNNVFNKKFNRTDIAYVYSEQEIDIINNLHRVTSLYAYDKKGKEVMSDAYSLKKGDLPKFEKIMAGTITASLKKYLSSYVKDKK